MSKLVNVRVANIRPMYKDLKEWMEDENNYYIGRAGIVFVNTGKYHPDGKPIKERFPKKNSKFANPYPVTKFRSRETAVRLYKQHIAKMLKEDRTIHNELKGKTLGCWCYPELCHGHVLMDLVKRFT